MPELLIYLHLFKCTRNVIDATKKGRGESAVSYSFWSLNCYFLLYPGRAFVLMMLSNK